MPHISINDLFEQRKLTRMMVHLKADPLFGEIADKILESDEALDGFLSRICIDIREPRVGISVPEALIFLMPLYKHTVLKGIEYKKARSILEQLLDNYSVTKDKNLFFYYK